VARGSITPPAIIIRALLACAVFLLAAAVIALRATNTRGELAQPGGTRAAADQVPASGGPAPDVPSPGGVALIDPDDQVRAAPGQQAGIVSTSTRILAAAAAVAACVNLDKAHRLVNPNG
jgi:hypothetical protein